MDDADFLESVADRLVELGHSPNEAHVARLRSIAALARWAQNAAKRRRARRRDTSWPDRPGGKPADIGVAGFADDVD